LKNTRHSLGWKKIKSEIYSGNAKLFFFTILSYLQSLSVWHYNNKFLTFLFQLNYILFFALNKHSGVWQGAIFTCSTRCVLFTFIAALSRKHLSKLHKKEKPKNWKHGIIIVFFLPKITSTTTTTLKMSP
jgi:hypothetical protein